MARSEVVHASVVTGTPEEIWARITSVPGINHELMPWLRMRFPRRLRGRSVGDLRPGERVGRVWLFYLGFLPLDFDDLTLSEVEPGSHFQERSTMLAMRHWDHRRSVRPLGRGRTEVRDELSFEPRMARTTKLAVVLVRAVFAHRHRRLRAWYDS